MGKRAGMPDEHLLPGMARAPRFPYIKLFSGVMLLLMTLLFLPSVPLSDNLAFNRPEAQVGAVEQEENLNAPGRALSLSGTRKAPVSQATATAPDTHSSRDQSAKPVTGNTAVLPDSPETATPVPEVEPAAPGVALAATPEKHDPPGSGQQPLQQVAVTEKLVALTFDDGPFDDLTEQYLAALKAAGAQATFFLVGNRARRYAGLVREIADQGHEIANHSLAHADLSTLGREAVLAELEKTNSILEEIGGRKPGLFRPPYGLWQDETLAAAAQAGLTVLTWSVDPRDWTDPPPKVVVNRVLAAIRPGAIVILHEGHPNTAKALPRLLDALRQDGYRLVTVSDLLAAAGKPPAPDTGRPQADNKVQPER